MENRYKVKPKLNLMMIIDNKYDIGQMVFLKTDVEQHEHIVTCLSIRPNGIIFMG